MAAGRLIRLSKWRFETEFPVYLVAATEPHRAIGVLRAAGVMDGRTAEDIGPISQRLIQKLGLLPDESMQLAPKREPGQRLQPKVHVRHKGTAAAVMG